MEMFSKSFRNCLMGVLVFASPVFAYDYVGTDSNNNGIRDDVDTLVSSMNTTDYKKQVLNNQAKVLQKVMAISLDDEKSVQTLGNDYMALMSCLAGVYTINGEDPFFMQLSRSITEKTFDTAERNKKFHSFLARIEKMNITEKRVGTSLCKK